MIPRRDSIALDSDGNEPLLAGSTRRRWLTRNGRLTCKVLRKILRRAPSVINYAIILIMGMLVLLPLFFSSYAHEPPSYAALRARCQEMTSGCGNPAKEKIFISVSLYDASGSLAGGLWGDNLAQLIHILGPENVFLSIYESDSGDAGRAALDSLRARVKCATSFVADEHVHFEDLPQVTLPGNVQRTKRIAFLAEIRNRSLRPLDKFVGDAMVEFDKVLFLNDVFFHPLDAALLMFNTNTADYLAACALDYSSPFDYYDTFALRDVEGFATSQTHFPILRNRGRGLSRTDIMAQKDAVRVKSCWGGMAVVQAKYIQNLNQSLPEPDFQAIGKHVVDPAKPSPPASGLVRFRHEPEPFYDACECCLFMADLAQAAKLSSAQQQRQIFVNPYIRVAYDQSVLGWLSIARYWERLFLPLYDLKDYVDPLPLESPQRLVEPGEKFLEEIWDNEQGKWRLTERVGRSGLFCGVHEMLLMRHRTRVPGAEGGSWTKTYFPPGQTLPFAAIWNNVLLPDWQRVFAMSSAEKQRVFFDSS